MSQQPNFEPEQSPPQPSRPKHAQQTIDFTESKYLSPRKYPGTYRNAKELDALGLSNTPSQKDDSSPMTNVSMHLRTLLAIAPLTRTADPERHRSRIIPLSSYFNSFKLRVLQAYVVGDNETVNVRKTPIMSFSCGKDASKERGNETLTVICWAMGDPRE
ncbi:hypothetical protein DL767_000174 [Monosporascus sp. MG133]|nr:hypothetical protein DL767_000174 [Monosporascus sp. MG133]